MTVMHDEFKKVEKPSGARFDPYRLIWNGKTR
jgi:hypothetical protein